MKKSISYTTVVLSLVMCFATIAFAQETTGNIEGTVKDAAGALVPNVTLTITNAKTSASGTTTTGLGTGFRRYKHNR